MTEAATRAERIANAQEMAENLMKCPANEQNMGNMLAVTAQAFRDLASVAAEQEEMLGHLRKRITALESGDIGLR